MSNEYSSDQKRIQFFGIMIFLRCLINEVLNGARVIQKLC